MSTINIVVGTVMGTALDVAKTVQYALLDIGHQVNLFESFDPALLAPNATLLVCTSTTGMGDLPQNIMPLYSTLTNDSPAIAELQFGLIALGDSCYPNFAQAGEKMKAALENNGALLLGEALTLDATIVDDHEAEALVWLESWKPLLST